VKFGPLWRRHDRPANPAVLGLALEAVKHVFAEDRGLVARVMPPPDPDQVGEWSKRLALAGFAFHDRAPDPDRYLVDLSLTESEQLASLGAKWRANLNKALAHRLDIREPNLKASLPDFLALYQTMLTRKHFVDRHNVDALPPFAAAAADASALGVRLVLAYHDDRPVAGSIIVGAGDRVFVAFSASDERALALRAGYALRWWIINRLRGSNARWLDLGGTEGDAGLRSFKLGNVGKRGRVLQIPGDYDFSENLLSKLVSSAMSSTHKLMRAAPAQHLLGLMRA
jgi:lipid II:glycine glycyltransferase (peptidoglycan interpeptide bridge formation enzyme)